MTGVHRGERSGENYEAYILGDRNHWIDLCCTRVISYPSRIHSCLRLISIENCCLDYTRVPRDSFFYKSDTLSSK